MCRAVRDAVGSAEPRSPLEPAERRLAALVLVAVVVAYAPVMTGTWVWDDHGWAERQVDLATALFAGEDSIWRPLGAAPVFILQWLLPLPWPHHVFSLALHLVGVTAVARIARGAGTRPTIAWLAAACFGLHPGASEAVAWMSSTTEIVPAALTLVGWAALTRGWSAVPEQNATGAGRGARGGRDDTGGGAWRGAYGAQWFAGACFALTPFGKEAWLLLPVSLLVWMLAAPRPIWRAWGVCVAGCVAYLVGRQFAGTSTSLSASDFEPFGPLGATTLRGFQLLFLPATADVFPLYEPAPTVGLIAVVGVLGTAVLARGRPAVAALLFSLPVLAPNALAAARTGILADRYYYLPLACIAVAAALGGETYARRSRAPRSLWLLPAIPLLLGVVTFRRTGEWRTDATLFGASLTRDPTNPYAAFRVGYDLHTRQHRCAEAIPLYRIGADVDDRAISGLQACLTELGRLDEIIALAPRARTLAARKNLIRTQLTLGRVDDALATCAEAVRAFPADAPLHALHGAALGRSGDLDAAASAFQRALDLDPGNVDARHGLETVAGLKAAALAAPEVAP